MIVIGYIIPIIALIVIIWAISVYNSLIKVKNQTKEAWSDIDVQLKRRYDLIPNLIETVKGYASHESNTLEAVISARSNAMNANGVKEKADAENMLSSTLKSLFAVTESYPDLKASQNFMHLQEELIDTENKIQASRRFYNGNVRDLNTTIQMFPSNIIAKIFNFKAETFFEITDAKERENVKVKF